MLLQENLHLKNINLLVHLELNNIQFPENNNGLSKLEVGWLNINPLSLEWLKLVELSIFEIDENAFYGSAFTKLEVLGMINIPINTLKSGTFNGLKCLKVLFLKNVRISRIEINLLEPIYNLEKLSIEECDSVKTSSLKNLFGTIKMNNLTDVYIRSCYWKDKINEQTFAGLIAIDKLSLISNGIDRIEPKSFDVALKTLKTLQLESNKLTSFPVDLFKTDRNIEIDLTGNPWHCNCELEHLRLFVQTTTNVRFTRLICKTPSQYEMVYLRECPALCTGHFNGPSITPPTLISTSTIKTELSLIEINDSKNEKDASKNEISTIKTEHTVEVSTVDAKDSKETEENYMKIYVSFEDETPIDNTNIIAIYIMIAIFTFIAGIFILFVLNRYL